MLPSQLTTLITQFTKLPGIGPRQAARFVFYLLRNENEITTLEDSLRSVRETVKLCANCFLPSLASPRNDSLCAICTNPKRDKNTICVVEKETDATNLEKTGHFRGHYFVLGGFIDPLQKESVAHERLSNLIQRFQKARVRKNFEIILALTPRREGDFTSLYIEEQLKTLGAQARLPGGQGHQIKATRLGRGLSSGAELEYADEETLRNALAGRK